MKKKQVATYGPSGLTEIRLRKLMTENGEVSANVMEAGVSLCNLYDSLRQNGYTEDDCFAVVKRIGMIWLGRYMEEDTNYEEYIVRTHKDEDWLL